MSGMITPWVLCNTSGLPDKSCANPFPGFAALSNDYNNVQQLYRYIYYSTINIDFFQYQKGKNY